MSDPEPRECCATTTDCTHLDDCTERPAAEFLGRFQDGGGSACSPEKEHIEWREQIGRRVFLAMTCTHDFEGSVCGVCWDNTQHICALIEQDRADAVQPCEHETLGCGDRSEHPPHAKVGDGRPCCGWPPRCDAVFDAVFPPVADAGAVPDWCRCEALHPEECGCDPLAEARTPPAGGEGR